MKTRRLLVLLIVGAVALALTGWWWIELRTVDGRTGAQWLALAQQAARTVSYHAEGRTVADGHTARFILDQADGGRYAMRVEDHRGRRCDLGYDGARLWYGAGTRSEDAATAPASIAPVQAHSRITGAGTVAGRPAVWLAVQSGQLHKTLAVDRASGVILAMRTSFRRQVISDMTVERITFVPVDLPRRTTTTPPAVRAAGDAELTNLLGHALLRPRWLPRGFRPAGAFADTCDCCKKPMALLRYSDGVSTLSLFEMRGQMQCAMTEGCHMAPDKGDLVDTRQFDDFSITAVGNLDAHALDKVLESLR